MQTTRRHMRPYAQAAVRKCVTHMVNIRVAILPKRGGPSESHSPEMSETNVANESSPNCNPLLWSCPQPAQLDHDRDRALAHRPRFRSWYGGYRVAGVRHVPGQRHRSAGRRAHGRRVRWAPRLRGGLRSGSCCRPGGCARDVSRFASGVAHDDRPRHCLNISGRRVDGPRAGRRAPWACRARQVHCAPSTWLL